MRKEDLRPRPPRMLCPLLVESPGTSGLSERFLLRLRGATGGLEEGGRALLGGVGAKASRIVGRAWAAPRPRMVAVRASSVPPNTGTYPMGESTSRRPSLPREISEGDTGRDEEGEL